jgi:hypothetical protein
LNKTLTVLFKNTVFNKKSKCKFRDNDRCLFTTFLPLSSCYHLKSLSEFHNKRERELSLTVFAITINKFPVHLQFPNNKKNPTERLIGREKTPQLPFIVAQGCIRKILNTTKVESIFYHRLLRSSTTNANISRKIATNMIALKRNCGDSSN